MRFLILTQYFPPEVGAPQTRLASVAHELVRLGHDVEVVTALPNYPIGRIFPEYKRTLYKREDWEGIEVHRVWLYACLGRGPLRLLNYISFAVSSLHALRKARRPDYVFVESPPLFLGIPGFLSSRRWGVPLILNIADLWPDSVEALGIMRRGLAIRAAERLEQWIYKKSDFITAVTEGIRTRLLEKKRVPAEKVIFLPNGVDTELFAPSAPDKGLKSALGLTGKDVVLYQGTQGYAHDLQHVLYAAQLLKQEQIHFLFVGDGSERHMLEKLKRKLRLSNVTFVDPVPKTELPRFCSIACCGLVSLRKNALFQAARPSKMFPLMSCAKPVVFSGEGEGAQLLEHARAGITVQPGDHEALANAVRAIISRPALAAELGRNGRRYVEEHLRWSSLVTTWLEDLTQSYEMSQVAAR